MTGPTDEEEVVPLRLQPVVARPEGWRGRSSTLIAAGLAAFIVIGLVLGAAFEDGAPTSSAAAIVSSGQPPSISPATTPRPRLTLRPRLPPLPARQVVGGKIPTERRIVLANGLQILDLATGRFTSRPRPDEDLLLPLGTDQFVCACIVRENPRPTPDVTLRLERLDLDGTPRAARDVVTFEGIVEVPDMTAGFLMSASLSADERSLFVLTAVRRPPVWAVELHEVDVITAELIATVAIDELPVDVDPLNPRPTGSIPAASPSAAAPSPRTAEGPSGIFVWATSLAASPGGNVVAAAIRYSEGHGDTWTSRFREWIVPLSTAPRGFAAPIPAAARNDAESWCIAPPEFVDHELLVQVCTSPETHGYYVRRATAEGRSLDDIELPDAGTDQWYPLAPVLDRSRRTVLAWDTVRHRLFRASVDDDASVAVRDVAPSMVPDELPRGGHLFDPIPGLVLSPDGQRLYALGFGGGRSRNGTPTGVWVFDAETLDLVDRWPARAMLTSIAVSADGQFVYAAGARGYDVEGNENPWPSSVTVYDAASGEIQVIYGQVATHSWIAFLPGS